ncbi:hypothetical protein Sj15T_38420 [Sphingobium sp. TA15]|uniref:DUF6285 domain-containing protein n=1 Tax=Sphingobium indicum (strain DSM 16413 / CCM 7287 / MTCC 6362 / UT26 / NBRC 101211 / UT26S) TaxID=452662 RepID=D4Z8F5_SPHIU|nr:DUF6285 domain-containing protein [Sphingobium indicum]BAI98774.1 hypothetical protein SJA_C2-04110 [Sphingobium indicum UT26S]BDD68821.1 hypothetical protein Sj15T_38420 [Sphingobium sp. TA15]
MQDEPGASELLDAVARFLRDDLGRLGQGETRFHALVTANAVDLARREIDLAPGFDEAERQRLSVLLGEDGDCRTLNALLCARLRSGALTADDPLVGEHLWLTTMEKLAVDQPHYSANLRARKMVRPTRFTDSHLRAADEKGGATNARKTKHESSH